MSRLRGLVVMVLVATTVISSTLAGCGTQTSKSGNPEVKEILIGSIHPMTGANAYEGQGLVNTAQMAIEEINANGGIKSLGGAKLKLAIGDNQGKPDLAASEAKRLIQQGAVVLIGTYTSASTLTATQEAEKAQTPFVIDVGSGTDILRRGLKYSFRLQPNQDDYSEDYLRYMNAIKTPDIKTVALVHENSVFGTYIANYIKKNIDKTGLTVVADISYPTSTATLDSEVTKLEGLKPDILVSTGYYQDTTLLMKTIKQRNLKFKGIIGVGSGAFNDPKFIQDIGAFSEGILAVDFYWNPKNPKISEMKLNYQKKFNQNFTHTSMWGYIAIKVIADALERSKSTDKNALRDALTETNYTNHFLPQEAIKFDSKGENVNAAAVMVQIQNGKQVVVYPEQYAEAKIVFPLQP